MKEVWKVLVVSVLFSGALVSLTVEKVSFIWTLRVVHRPAVPPSTGYAALAVLLLCPYLLGVVQTVWTVSFLTRCRHSAMPPLASVLCGLVGSCLEGVCVVSVVSQVLPHLPVFLALPALGSVLTLTSLSPALSTIHAPDTNSAKPSPQKAESGRCGGGAGRGRVWLSVLGCLSAPLSALTLALAGSLPWLRAVAMACSLLLLGLVWAPAISHRALSVRGTVTHNCRRLTLLYALVRILSVAGFLLVHLLACRAGSVLEGVWGVYRGFSQLGREGLVLPLVVNLTSGLLSHGLAYLSLALCQPVTGLLLPSVLSTLTSTVLCVACLGPYLYHTDELRDFGDPVPLLLSAGMLVCGWALACVLRALDALKKPGFLFMPYEDLLLDYGWCPGLSDQRRLLSYCAEGVSRDKVLGQRSAAKSRVYVCTTMYREADYEMERLLLSIQKLSGSDKLPGVYLETHIFMDNGVEENNLGDFAKQLVGLLVTRVGMDPGEARCLVTPYGRQLVHVLPGGMPLFVHLKDPLKVKPKKRWSQCMYMKYIMDFRKALWRRDEDSDRLRLQRQGEAGDACSIHDECAPHAPRHPSHPPLSGPPPAPTPLSDGTYSLLPSTSQQQRHPEPQASPLSPPACNGTQAGTQHPGEAYVSNGTHVRSLSDAPDTAGADVKAHHPPDADVTSCGDVGCDQGGRACDDVSHSAGQAGVYHHDPRQEVDDDHTYILATDADMDFEPQAIAELLHLSNDDLRIGAACGRTHPVGRHCSTIVCHQIFEYAKDFWMIKSGQNVIGSVMCCPGCFSLYRARALRQVMDAYATPTNNPFSVYVKDTGEDRWMATLMMLKGWRLRYSAFADNTTYCPDTFQEFFKQRRRWILSDMANLMLVVRNLPQLLRNNQCFSLVYVLYLLNMFMNNIITPGTAIVMITAGMELVFEVPYVYTTPALATVVYVYAILCTRCSTHAQGVVTSVLTVALGAIFASVAVWGSYLIISRMVAEIGAGGFHFQQHYVILMLTLSLLYAALVHPREMWQLVHGLAYLFIFPAMHLLLPIYSIANIVDQSWGTRDSQSARIPQVKCIPNLLKLMKRKNKNKGQTVPPDDSNADIQDMVTSMTRTMADGHDLEQAENKFWESVRHTLLGNDVNTGLERAELAACLERLRDRSLLGLLSLNVLWLAVLSYFYVGIQSPISRLNLYGIISGALYGFTLIIQVIGMTVSRVHFLLIRLARYLYGAHIPMWTYLDDKRPQ